MPFTKRTVVVAGASAGVGRAIATKFGQAGWQVALIARGRDGLERAKAEIEAAGGRAIVIPADVSDADALLDAAARVERDLGPIDAWVNNAMVTVYATCTDVSPDEFLQVTRVTYLGQVYGTQAALKHMRPRNRGTVVCIGSALAYRSIPFQGPYCAAKAAVRGFVDALRTELMWEGSAVHVTMVQLPAVNTPQFDWARNKLGRKLAPVPPIFQPETVADAVFRAVHTKPREYWLGFSTIKAIVGQMLAPAFADRVLADAGLSNETVDQPAELGRPDNLFEAGKGDPGAHGRFDGRSKSHAMLVDPRWLRFGLAATIAGTVALVTTSAARLRTKQASRARR